MFLLSEPFGKWNALNLSSSKANCTFEQTAEVMNYLGEQCLPQHLQGDCHKAFSKTDEYSVVDRLASALHCDFLQFQTKVRRSFFFFTF